MKLDVPSSNIVDAAGNLDTSWASFFGKVKNDTVWRGRAETTANRPTVGIEVGTPYFDTTLGKPIWALTVPGGGGAITWVDATGAVV